MLVNLKARSELLKQIRQFFDKQSFIEVHTPVMASTTVTDPNIESFAVSSASSHNVLSGYLQTSPEYCMKRLLATVDANIYQICPAFRCEEVGRFHQPEFTMLEWYALGFNLERLMEQASNLLAPYFSSTIEQISFRSLLQSTFSLDPVGMTVDSCRSVLMQEYGELPDCLNLTDCYNLLYDRAIRLYPAPTYFVYHFMEEQAMLSNVRLIDGVPLSMRCEFIAHGVEVANGCEELVDSSKLRMRFANDCETRKSRNQFVPEVDEKLLSVLDGIPPCAGMALGVDRLFMLLEGKEDLASVLPFPAI